jgi:hypothetical protein
MPNMVTLQVLRVYTLFSASGIGPHDIRMAMAGHPLQVPFGLSWCLHLHEYEVPEPAFAVRTKHPSPRRDIRSSASM